MRGDAWGYMGMHRNTAVAREYMGLHGGACGCMGMHGGTWGCMETHRELTCEGQVLGGICSLHNLAHRQVKLLSTLIVPSIMCWYRHDCTTAVASENIVSNPDGNCLLVDWIDCIAACNCRQPASLQ